MTAERRGAMAARRLLPGLACFAGVSGAALAQRGPAAPGPAAMGVAALGDFPVVELRRYTIRDGEREHFAQYFESWFPEAFEQLGAIAAGAFFERDHPGGFTWIRGFHTLDARATVNAAFYYGPLWKEHKQTLNDLILDSDNVLLLQALTPEHAVSILPAVDPVSEAGGAHGVIVVQIFAVAQNGIDALLPEAEKAFARYRTAGAREAGVLVTLDVANNFPQLPVRTDGPYLVWLGILRDDAMLDRGFRPAAEQASRALGATGLLRGAPELIVLDPSRRSRLRWRAEPGR